MYRTKNRTHELIRRTIVYTTMVLSMIALLIILMLFMLGYRYDIASKTLKQTGLVQYDSFPRDAMVSVDDQQLARTRTKSTNLPGQHQFSMTIDGYEPWQKTLTIKANTVTHLNYARLVPTSKTTDTVRSFPKLESARFSPAGRFVIGVASQESPARIVWGDLRSTDRPQFTEQTLEGDILRSYAEDTHSHALNIKEWDLSGRYVILRHAYQTRDGRAHVQWLRLDRDKPREVTDVSRVIGLDVKDITFIGTGGNAFYVLQNTGELRRADVADNTISGPLLHGVQRFSLYGDDIIAYIGLNDAKLPHAGIWKKAWKKPQVVRQLTKAEANLSLHVAVSRYFHKDTVAVAVDKTITFYRGSLPGANDIGTEFSVADTKRFTLARPVASLEFNDDGRFILARDYVGFVSYDLEHHLLSQPAYVSHAQAIDWLDKFHVWTVQDGALVMQEFDGGNKHELVPATAGYDTALSQDERFIYYFHKAADGTVQLRVLYMTVKN